MSRISPDSAHIRHELDGPDDLDGRDKLDRGHSFDGTCSLDGRDRTDALLDALAYDIAVEEAERGISSDSDDWATEVDALLREQLARMQRRLTPADVKVRRMKPISPALLVMARDVLVAMVEDLRRAGSLRYAHRELSILSDDDLRRLIELQRIAPQDLE